MIQMFKKNQLLIIVVLILVSCKNQVDNKISDDLENKQKINYAGNYVDSSYEKRNEGYDWVAVKVSKKADSIFHFAVRSRTDKKKPTCTFDVDAVKVNDSIFEANIDGATILFIFSNNNLEITNKTPDDENILYYYCSGGGSLKAKYQKINSPIDSTIDKRIYARTLSFKNLFFDIQTIGEGSIQQLAIKPNGLEIVNDEITITIDGSVVDAEIEDLNSDGYPEILIYTVSAGSGSYGNVIGYSVNNGKSMSQIYFPPVSQNEKISEGYMGHDEFAIVETTLVQRFKLYNEGDTNANPTGKTRQIQYKLVDGEASRRFVIDKIIEY